MEQKELEKLLACVAGGEVSVEDAMVQMRTAPYSDLGFAKVDHHRGIRQGASEVIYGAGKTPDQIAAIIADMISAGQERVLITRLAPEAAQELQQLLSEGLVHASDARDASDALEAASGEAGASNADGHAVSGQHVAAGGVGAQRAVSGSLAELTVDAMAGDVAVPVPDLPVFTYYDLPQLATVGEAPVPDGAGQIVVACGGTSDIYAAEEAAITAEMMGNEVVRLYDVGVAGLHRLLSHAEDIARARVIVAVAGMEGALASVVGGMASCPVIAVPTSVGYGASFNGLSALLAMLNSCASGVSVVNIDNGFGAGYQASLINHVR